MSFIVAVDHDKNIVDVKCNDVVCAQDLMDYEREYWVGEVHQGYHHCLDLRECLLDIEFAELFMLASHAVPKEANSYTGARTAILVADTLQEELATFYRDARHEFCPPEVREVAVFEDEARAHEWLNMGTLVTS